MRRRLREIQNERKNKDEIRKLQFDVTRLFFLISQNQGAEGGAETGPSWIYVRESKTALPDPSTVPVYARGHIDGEGDDNGFVCFVSPDKTKWLAVNACEIIL